MDFLIFFVTRLLGRVFLLLKRYKYSFIFSKIEEYELGRELGFYEI